MSISPCSPNCRSHEGAAPNLGTQPAACASDDAPTEPTLSVAIRSKEMLDLNPSLRAFMARSGDEGSIPAERLLAIRQRVLDGSYDTRAVLDAIAAKMRRSGVLS